MNSPFDAPGFMLGIADESGRRILLLGICLVLVVRGSKTAVSCSALAVDVQLVEHAAGGTREAHKGKQKQTRQGNARTTGKDRSIDLSIYLS